MDDRFRMQLLINCQLLDDTNFCGILLQALAIYVRVLSGGRVTLFGDESDFEYVTS